MDTRQLLILAAVAAVTMAAAQMPRFEFTPSSNVLLTRDGTWEVGSPNKLAILKENEKITVRVKVVGDTGGEVNRKLFFKCPKSVTEVSTELSKLPTMSETYECASTISFKLSALSTSDGERFELKMGWSKLNYSDVFRESVELWVKVRYSSGDLVSNRLFLWSLGPITSFSTASTSPGERRTFLTDEAVSDMANMRSFNVVFKSTQFIDPQIIGVLRDAPYLFKSQMNLGAVLFFDASRSCANVEFTKSIMFVSGYSKFVSENSQNLKFLRLSIDDGKLWYDPCYVGNEATRFIGRLKQPTIKICTFVSFSDERQPYQQVGEVQEPIPVGDNSYVNCANGMLHYCEVISGTNPNMTILSGLGSTAIVCPIICNFQRNTAPYRFYKNGRHLKASNRADWTIVDGLNVSRVGNVVEFPPTASSRHDGIYRCEVELKSFSYNVKVISLPVFQSQSVVESFSERDRFSGILPPRMFAMEGEYLSYACEVRFSGLQTVRIVPEIYFTSKFMHTPVWSKFTIDQNRSKLNNGDELASIRETSIGNHGKRLNITILRVPSPNSEDGTDFSHRFLCNAFIDKSESMMFVMPEYAVQSGSDVVFIPRLTRRDFLLSPQNNCSVQNCSLKHGAVFEFGLTLSTGKFLADAGVDVYPSFRMDNERLEKVDYLFDEGSADQIETISYSRTISLVIHTVQNQKLAKNLMKKKKITAIFNLHYMTYNVPPLNLHNMKLDKARHVRPNAPLGSIQCLQDPLCFYSTDFDVESSLSFLSVDLTFGNEPERSERTSSYLF